MKDDERTRAWEKPVETNEESRELLRPRRSSDLKSQKTMQMVAKPLMESSGNPKVTKTYT